MALTQTITTAGTTLAKLQRKVQGSVLKGFKTTSEEWGLIQRLRNFDLQFSAREVTTPIDIVDQPSGAFIPEGGYEANPVTAAPQELTFTWANFNARWNLSVTSRLIDKKNRQAQLIRQTKYQTMKLTEALQRRVGVSFYGLSTGVLALTSTNATQSSGTYTLIDAYGQAALDNAAYLASFFAVGDRVALIRAGALVTNALGTVTAVSTSAGTIDVTWAGSVDSDANDQIVLANSVENASIAGTDWNQSPVGLLDMVGSTSVHGLSGSNYPKWTAALNDTTGGRFSPARLMKADHEIGNKGGGKMDLVIMAQGVLRDAMEAERSVLRYGDPMNLSLDGALKTGTRQHTSRKVPNGYVWVMDSRTLRKWALVDIPGEEGPGVPEADDEGFDKVADRNAHVFSFDFPYQFVTQNRGNIAQFSGLSEQ